jgi:putative restriction endonuclease
MSLMDAEKKGREARFRVCVLYAYNFMCSLTRYRLSTINNESIVDAAHIHQFSESGNNDPRNGIALCKNAHWLFERGLWSLDDAYRVIVATSQIDEETQDPGTKTLADFQGQQIHLPKNEAVWPDLQYVRWHRENRFKGEKDAVA